MPDWTMPMNFVRSHAECQYQFLKSIWEDRHPGLTWPMVSISNGSWPPPSFPRQIAAGSS